MSHLRPASLVFPAAVLARTSIILLPDYHSLRPSPNPTRNLNRNLYNLYHNRHLFPSLLPLPPRRRQWIFTGKSRRPSENLTTETSLPKNYKITDDPLRLLLLWPEQQMAITSHLHIERRDHPTRPQRHVTNVSDTRQFRSGPSKPKDVISMQAATFL